MIINFPLLLLTLLLLWFPRRWLRLGAVLMRRRSRPSERIQDPWNTREPGDPRVDFRAEFAKFRNYVDLVRAAAGGVCLMGQWNIDACLQVATDASAAQGMGLLAIKSLIFLIALLIQTLRYEKHRFTFYPPIFFLAGQSVPLCSPWGALFAFVLIWAVNPMLGNAQTFLSVYAVLVAVFGNYFSGLGAKSVILAALLCFLPVLLSLMAQRPLVIFTRKSERSSASQS